MTQLVDSTSTVDTFRDAPARPEPRHLQLGLGSQLRWRVGCLVADGAMLGWAVLAYVAAVVLMITLEPFAFHVPAHAAVTWWAPDGPWRGWFDIVMNVALFLPLGFLGALAIVESGHGARIPLGFARR